LQFIHIITGEYPPDLGGVADYAAQVAAGLAAAGQEVHVWCGGDDTTADETQGVLVHRCAGAYDREGIRQLSAGLNARPMPRRLLVQYVPHAFGCHAMNLRFIGWLWWRGAVLGDQVDIMFHELAFPFVRRPLKHNLIAIVNRLMLFILLLVVRNAYLSTDAWRPMLARYSLGRIRPQTCPVPSNVPFIDDPPQVHALRSRLMCGPAGELLGHFGTYPPSISRLLLPVVLDVMESRQTLCLLLMGRGSAEFRDGLIAREPTWSRRIFAVEGLSAAEISVHLQACDVLLQPYPDGATTRRTSLMSGLSHGIATVTTWGESSEPVWRDQPLTPAVSVDDVPGIIRWLHELLDDPGLRVTWGRRARAYYDAHFSLDHTLQVLLEHASEKVCDVRH